MLVLKALISLLPWKIRIQLFLLYSYEALIIKITHRACERSEMSYPHLDFVPISITSHKVSRTPSQPLTSPSS